jgi:hypothetical protein
MWCRALLRYRRGFTIDMDVKILQEYAYSALVSAEASRVAIEKFNRVAFHVARSLRGLGARAPHGAE